MVRRLTGGCGRGFFTGDGLVTLSGTGTASIFSSFASLVGLAGGVGRCTPEGLGSSLGSAVGTSGFSLAGFLGGRGLANLSFCGAEVVGLSGST